MQLCELIARKNEMKGVMLTCFKNNPAAMGFYLEKASHDASHCCTYLALDRFARQLKYVVDPISPSYVNPLGDAILLSFIHG